MAAVMGIVFRQYTSVQLLCIIAKTGVIWNRLHARHTRSMGKKGKQVRWAF